MYFDFRTELISIATQSSLIESIYFNCNYAFSVKKIVKKLVTHNIHMCIQATNKLIFNTFDCKRKKKHLLKLFYFDIKPLVCDIQIDQNLFQRAPSYIHSLFDMNQFNSIIELVQIGKNDTTYNIRNTLFIMHCIL